METANQLVLYNSQWGGEKGNKMEDNYQSNMGCNKRITVVPDTISAVKVSVDGVNDQKKVLPQTLGQNHFGPGGISHAKRGSNHAIEVLPQSLGQDIHGPGVVTHAIKVLSQSLGQNLYWAIRLHN